MGLQNTIQFIHGCSMLYWWIYLVCFVLLVSLYTRMSRVIFPLPRSDATSAVHLFAISLLQPFSTHFLQLLTSVCDDYPYPPPWINRTMLVEPPLGCSIISYVPLHIVVAFQRRCMNSSIAPTATSQHALLPHWNSRPTYWHR